jgi:RNA 2',3'-cyclic 3'-phosphodiesterase
MRLFVGIALAGAVVRELETVVARLQSSGGGLRWTEPDSWHVTLQFLGNTTPEQYDCLMARLSEVRYEPVRVQLGSLDCFDRAGVFFADVAATSDLAALAKRVLAATGGCGFVAEARPFHPHITLARAKGQGRGAELRALASRMRGKPAFTPFMAREFLLYESHLGVPRARYEVRGRFPLIGPTSDV